MTLGTTKIGTYNLFFMETTEENNFQEGESEKEQELELGTRQMSKYTFTFEEWVSSDPTKRYLNAIAITSVLKHWLMRTMID